MNFVPVIHRELRRTSRKPMTYYRRCLAAATVLFLSLGLLYAGWGGLFTPNSAGQNLFILLSSLGYIYVLLDGVFVTADALSEEKREGTIGLLFLTDLKGYDVVLGKLISRSLNVLFCVWAALPAPAVAFVLGGVTLADYLRMMPVLMNTLFFALSVGMFVSSFCKNGQKAGALGMLIIVLLAFGLPALGWMNMATRGAPTIDPAYLALSPAGAFLAALGPSNTWTPGANLWRSFFVTHLSAWIFLALASLIITRTWQEKSVRPNLLSNWVRGLAERWERLRQPPKDPDRKFDPALWLSERGHRLLVVFWSFYVVLAVSAIAIFAFTPAEAWIPLFAACCIGIHYALKFELAVQAARVFAEDRRTGVLELLLTTPLGEDQLIRGRMLALKRQFFGPTLLVVVIDFLLLFSAWFNLEWMERLGTLVCLLFFLLVQLGEMYSIAWIGLWFGLSCRTAFQAVRRTLFYALVLPIPVVLGFTAMFAMVTGGRGMRSGAIVGIAFVGWLVALIIVNSGACARAISQLRDELRTTASQIFVPLGLTEGKRKWWQRKRSAAPTRA
ncbi:MAG: ABC transporter permease subunit [Verrucomicrobiota bacterium]|jgi:ABC-type transport system involved in multi-copper enzyme maturation permease subunit